MPVNCQAVADTGIVLSKVYTTNEAACVLRMSKRTLLKYVKAKRIGYVRSNGKFLFRGTALDIFLERNSIRAKAA